MGVVVGVIGDVVGDVGSIDGYYVVVIGWMVFGGVVGFVVCGYDYGGVLWDCVVDCILVSFVVVVVVVEVYVDDFGWVGIGGYVCYCVVGGLGDGVGDIGKVVIVFVEYVYW